METSKFLKIISEQFLDEDQDKVTLTGEFRKLGTWDSLTGMAILAIIEDECDVTIPVEEFLKLKTVQELYNYVYTK